MVRVLIADDHLLIRRNIRILLEKTPQLTVVGEAVDGLDALDLVVRQLADVLILDLFMPKMSGFQVLEKIIEARIPVRVVILSLYSDEMFVRRAIKLGAMGYVLKSGIVDDLPESIIKVVRGEYFFSPDLPPEMVASLFEEL